MPFIHIHDDVEDDDDDEPVGVIAIAIFCHLRWEATVVPFCLGTVVIIIGFGFSWEFF
jgi:hypothetical protein